MRLNVILRTCSDSLLTPKHQERICGGNRQLLIKKCFLSLVNTIQACSHDVHLTVLDDHSDQGLLEFITSYSEHLSINLVHMKSRGANASALAQFEAARDSDGLVYVVEDDYLHETNALEHMINAYVHFMKRYNTDIVIYPYDCNMRYTEGKESATMLYHDAHRYWRSVDKTANTMLTHYSTFKTYWSVFENLAINYPKVTEDDTINRLYWSQENPDAPIRAFNPIPSCAYHMGYSTPTQIGTDHSQWQHLWNRIESWQLIQGWFYKPEFYQQVVDQLPLSATVVEIGAWRGRSTCCLASIVQKSGKQIKIYAVDTWEGSQESIHQQIINNLPNGLYYDFLENLKFCQVDHMVTPLKLTSQQASTKFEDQSLDFVMIDGGHDYESVKLDIQSWTPKVKPGGIIAGDDYSLSWPGVIRAVDEAFGSLANTQEGLWWLKV